MCQTTFRQLTVRSEDAESFLHELSLLPRIEAMQMAALQATSSSLRAATSLLARNTDAYKAIRTLAPQVSNLITTLQQRAALSALQVGRLHERFHSITIADANSYAWLLPNGSDPNAPALPSLTEPLATAKKIFLDWLETGTGFFYMSGKPGAGKSTLMKFICRHPQLYDVASRWGGDATLVLGRFFFWKPGTPEQKSIRGMLRGLLYSILEARPDIAAVAMTELCKSLLGDEAVAVSDEDVKNAFQNMLSAFSHSKNHTLMLVVDGLDEFEGEHSDLLALMQSWVSRYPSTIKICVSSREYGIFESFFAQAPKFRLQELTRDDMALLIASRFGASTVFARLPGRDLDSLTALLVDRAAGVFLWVVLAVASLEDGMESGDIKNGGVLEGRARHFPSELDDFLPYVHKSVSEHSRPWAYKAIELVRFAQFTVAGLLSAGEGYTGVGLAEFMLMDEASSSWNLSLFAPRSDSKTVSVEQRLDATRRKVLCRPKGFLAVSNLPYVRTWPANGSDKLYMTYTHRSVVEFLESPPAVATMAPYIGSFDPFLALASSDLAALRFAPPTDYPLLKGRDGLPPGDSVELSALLADSLVRRFSELIGCAASLGKAGSARFLSVLDAMGDAIKRHLTLILPLQRIRLAVEDNSPHQVLVNLTLASHLFEYSEWKRKQPMQGDGKRPMSSGLFHAFHAMIQRCRSASKPTTYVHVLEGGELTDVIDNPPPPSGLKTSMERLLRVLHEFFENGLDLNWRWHGTWQGATTTQENAWTCWHAILWAIVIGTFPHDERHADVLALLLKHGAAMDVTIIAAAPQGPLEKEDLEPADGWYLVSPFGGRISSTGEKRHAGVDATGRDAMLPAVLMHESLPVVQWAKERDWVLTFRDLVPLRFREDTSGLAALMDDVVSNEVKQL